MPSRTPRGARLELAEPLQDILRCLTDDGFVAQGSQAGGPFVTFFQRRVVTLRRNDGLDPILLRLAIEYTIHEASGRARWWEVSIVGWVYEILNSAGRPIFAFHWHPSSGRVTWPHLHAHGTHAFGELHKLHPPTGPVTRSSVVRFLIDDLDVLPRRTDWRAVLERHAAV